MGALNDAAQVRAQYATAEKLNQRISIHAKYSRNRQGFSAWIGTHYPVFPEMEVLELGCGTGAAWRGLSEIVEQASRIVLTDFSEGMLEKARDTLDGIMKIEFAVADIQDIPYADISFDLVIANMMLYHVPDIRKALREVRRVLRPGGTFVCATYGENGIMEYLAGLFRDHGVREEANHTFTLQNGRTQLERVFESVHRFDYDDALEVTDVSDLADYIYSLTGMSSLRALPRETVLEVLKRAQVDGVLHVPKEYGLFLAK
ncbi:MAG: class I SAM-dependent methyltransferase [Clostridia bacterium]|nr:class I SAM-dependent methyltransferase [Clostridia bacterium]